MLSSGNAQPAIPLRISAQDLSISFHTLNFIGIKSFWYPKMFNEVSLHILEMKMILFRIQKWYDDHINYMCFLHVSCAAEETHEVALHIMDSQERFATMIVTFSPKCNNHASKSFLTSCWFNRLDLSRQIEIYSQTGYIKTTFTTQQDCFELFLIYVIHH